MPEDAAAAAISRAFDIFNESQRTGIVSGEDLDSYWDPEILHVTRFAALEGRVYEGHAGIERFLAETREEFERFDVRLERVAGDGDRRVAIYVVAALTRSSQIPIEQRLGMEIELRNGRLYRTKVHADPREALEAAGLDPAA